ncbi:MAG: hypothetical protein JSR47_05760 [Proteobacteria bacterium]|nr:hypothetical protein [Pseudomonadota bacterium]
MRLGGIRVRMRAGAYGAVCAGLVLSLSACDTFRNLALYPSPPPLPADVAGELRDFDDAWTKIKKVEGTDAATAVAYVSMGYVVADRACNAFFTNLRKLRNDTSMAKDVTRDLAASAGIITSLASAPTAVLTGIFGATGVFPGIVDDFQKTFLFADAGDSLYPLISSMMASYRVNFPAIAADLDAREPSTAPILDKEKKQIQFKKATRFNATQRVRQHAALCSIPYLTYVLKTGVLELTKPTVAGKADATAAGAKAGEAAAEAEGGSSDVGKTAGAAAAAAAAAGATPAAATAAGTQAVAATGVTPGTAAVKAAAAGAAAGAAAAANPAPAPLASGGATNSNQIKINGQGVGAR